MLNNLLLADKVLSTKIGFLIKRKVIEESNESNTAIRGFVDFTLLTTEERKYVL